MIFVGRTRACTPVINPGSNIDIISGQSARSRIQELNLGIHAARRRCQSATKWVGGASSTEQGSQCPGLTNGKFRSTCNANTGRKNPFHRDRCVARATHCVHDQSDRRTVLNLNDIPGIRILICIRERGERTRRGVFYNGQHCVASAGSSRGYGTKKLHRAGIRGSKNRSGAGRNRDLADADGVGQACTGI